MERNYKEGVIHRVVICRELSNINTKMHLLDLIIQWELIQSTYEEKNK